MDFSLSAAAQDASDRMWAFMREEVFPADWLVDREGAKAAWGSGAGPGPGATGNRHQLRGRSRSPPSARCGSRQPPGHRPV